MVVFVYNQALKNLNRIHDNANADQYGKNQVSVALVCDQHANTEAATVRQDDEQLLSNGGRRERWGRTRRRWNL